MHAGQDRGAKAGRLGRCQITEIKRPRKADAMMLGRAQSMAGPSELQNLEVVWFRVAQ